MDQKKIKDILLKITVEPVMFLYMFGSFLQYATYQALVYRRTCHLMYEENAAICENLYNRSYKEEDNLVQKEASSWLMYTNIAYSVPSIITVTFLLGPYGDRVGRKLPIVIPITGSMLYTVSNLILSNTMAPNAYLLVGNLISGFTGGYVTIMMAIYSYIGHTSTKEFRTIKIGITEAMISLSATLGNFVSGIMLDHISFTFVFAFIFGVQLMALFYTLAFVKDVTPETEPDGTANGGIFGQIKLSMKDTWLCVSKHRESSRTLYIFLLVFVIFILQTCTVGEGDIFYLYVKLPKFNWSQTTYGYNSALGHSTRSFAILVFLPILRRVADVADTTLAIAGLISKIAGLILLGFAAYTWQVFLVAIVGILQSFPSVAVRSLMSGMVEKSEQGKLFGLVASAESISSFIATLIFNNLYSATLQIEDGFCFLFSAGLTLLTLLIMVLLHRSLKHRSLTKMYSHMEEDPKTARDIQT